MALPVTPLARWPPPNPSNERAAGDELLCYTLVSLFCAGTGPSFPQESQCPGADISPIPKLALLETGHCHKLLSQQQGRAPRALVGVLLARGMGDDGLPH